MLAIRDRRMALAIATVLVSTTPLFTSPTKAQIVVYDPTNYVQNALQAARSLQQVTNQITSLQNEAQMLIDQARNLANLPYLSLQQLQQSVARTQALLQQAQRIAYDVQQIDRLPPRSASPIRNCARSTFKSMSAVLVGVCEVGGVAGSLCAARRRYVRRSSLAPAEHGCTFAALLQKGI
jgi:conjugal transfer/entry exclusion protein